MLAQFALIVFALLGVMSMVIDLGYVRLTQVQMQNAADAGAIAGVRGRNADSDGFWSDCARRTAVQQLVQWTFDDNLDVNSVDPNSPQNFGAGPTVAFTDGDGTPLNAYQNTGDLGVYKPTLGLNQSGNIQSGDMVSGNFNPDPALRGTEDGAYNRDDFTRLDPIPPDPLILQKCGDPPPATPNVTLVGSDNNAFLVRLRRSNETAGATDPPDAFSTGPTLPLMFARGMPVHGDGGSAYNPRTDGLTIRATAIARVRPAMRVGLPQSGAPGVTPFTLDSTFAQSLGIAGSPVTIAADGTIQDGSGAAVGRFVPDPSSINTVGNAVPPAVAAECAPVAGYGPVYSAIGASGASRIVGFVRIELGCAPAMLSRGAGLVAATNATALLAGGLAPGIPSVDVPLLMNANAALGAAALLAPVLAR